MCVYCSGMLRFENCTCGQISTFTKNMEQEGSRLLKTSLNRLQWSNDKCNSYKPIRRVLNP